MVEVGEHFSVTVKFKSQPAKQLLWFEAVLWLVLHGCMVSTELVLRAHICVLPSP